MSASLGDLVLWWVVPALAGQWLWRFWRLGFGWRPGARGARADPKRHLTGHRELNPREIFGLSATETMSYRYLIQLRSVIEQRV